MEMEKMKAAIHVKYGKLDGIIIDQIKKPTPKENELLIKIVYSSLTPSDILLHSGKFPLLFWIPIRLLFGFFRPRRLILGYEFSGIIHDIGSEVTQFKIGEEVFGATYWKMSTHAEYICLKEKAAIARIPENLSLKEAAVLPDGASTALSFLEKANIREGEHVLIHGSSGSVGTYAVQIAKYLGAKVTAVCSYRNVDLVKTLGADDVIDYTKEDYGDRTSTYDIVFDTVGKTSFFHARKSLKRNGRFVSTGLPILKSLTAKIFGFVSSKRCIGGMVTSNQTKLNRISDMVRLGKVIPVIDKVFSMENIHEAHSYVETGRKRGNVVISIH